MTSPEEDRSRVMSSRRKTPHPLKGRASSPTGSGDKDTQGSALPATDVQKDSMRGEKDNAIAAGGDSSDQDVKLGHDAVSRSSDAEQHAEQWRQ